MGNKSSCKAKKERSKKSTRVENYIPDFHFNFSICKTIYIYVSRQKIRKVFARSKKTYIAMLHDNIIYIYFLYIYIFVESGSGRRGTYTRISIFIDFLLPGKTMLL